MCIGFYRHKRQVATHVFVIMISPEDRRVKPYALPVQLVSYAGLNQSRVRSIINGVIAEMTKREMKVAGKIFFMYLHVQTLGITHVHQPFTLKIETIRADIYLAH